MFEAGEERTVGVTSIAKVMGGECPIGNDERMNWKRKRTKMVGGKYLKKSF